MEAENRRHCRGHAAVADRRYVGAMPVEDLTLGERMGSCRGSTVVCIPVYGAFDQFVQCFASVLVHTEPDLPILVCDDASADPDLRPLIVRTLTDGEWPHTVHYVRQPRNVGFVENINSAFVATAPADVIILNSDCIVTDGWAASLRAAAYSDSRVATATALTNAGTIVSVPYRNHPIAVIPQDWTADRMADAIRSGSARLRPDLPTCVGHCVYIRRSAIELVGELDTSFSPGYEEEVDFSQRCLQHGLRHVAADDVFVLHRHSGSFGSSETTERLRYEHHLTIAARYPYYDDWVEEVRSDPSSRLARSVANAARAMRGPSVTIDGRCLTPFMTGTALATLELISALDAHTDLAVRVLLPADVGEYARRTLAERPGIETLPLAALDDDWVEPTDVAHRPYQVLSPQDPLILRRLGYRVVVTQLDSIAFRNPAYFGDYNEWRGYRRLAAATLAAADQVVFISRHAADDARILELVAEDRINVISEGTDHMLSELYPERTRPAEAGSIGERSFLLCLGADFLHKNRLFAIRLLEELVESGAFDGLLVFAGPKAENGSSAGEEAGYLAARPGLARRVLDLGAVPEAQKLWLLAEAAAVVYPTTYEGFGLVPFEAARAGTPCLFAWHTSLADALPESAALIVPWNARETATRVAPVLRPGPARDQAVAAVRMAGARLTGSRKALLHAEVYARARAGAPPTGARIAEDALALRDELDAARAELDSIYENPLNRGLVGPYAILPDELRRPVLAIAARPALRVTASAIYRAGYALLHGARKPPT